MIKVYDQSNIKTLTGENIYSFLKTNISNLDFTGSLFIVGNEQYITEIFLNNLPLQTQSLDNYLMINPNTMQIYSGKNNNPQPPVPDIITIPNLITNQITAQKDNLYINNIDTNTIRK